jgi:hypothetical protein
MQFLKPRPTEIKKPKNLLSIIFEFIAKSVINQANLTNFDK